MTKASRSTPETRWCRLVSPMYCTLHLQHCIIYMRFVDEQAVFMVISMWQGNSQLVRHWNSCIDRIAYHYSTAIFFYIKRALHFASKLDSRHIKKCNCFLMDCSPLLAKQYWPTGLHRNTCSSLLSQSTWRQIRIITCNCDWGGPKCRGEVIYIERRFQNCTLYYFFTCSIAL